MDFSYEEYEKACEEVRRSNAGLLSVFEDELTAKGLARKTIERHIFNVDLYINDYLLREEARPMEDGVAGLDGFFDFFIRKCAWSTPASVKGMAASLKKFYQCMAAHGKIDQEDLDFLKDEIKEGVPHWQKECADYNEEW